jgi:hypothetical protein
MPTCVCGGMNENCMWCNGSGESRHLSRRLAGLRTSKRTQRSLAPLEKCPLCGVGVRKLAKHLRKTHSETSGAPDASQAKVSLTPQRVLSPSPPQQEPCSVPTSASPANGKAVKASSPSRRKNRFGPVVDGKSPLGQAALQLKHIRESPIKPVGSVSNPAQKRARKRRKKPPTANVPSFLGPLSNSSPSHAKPLYPASAGSSQVSKVKRSKPKKRKGGQPSPRFQTDGQPRFEDGKRILQGGLPGLGKHR